MKWTEAGKILRAGFSQADVIADDADDIGLELEVLGEIGRIRHAAEKIVGQRRAI